MSDVDWYRVVFYLCVIGWVAVFWWTVGYLVSAAL